MVVNRRKDNKLLYVYILYRLNFMKSLQKLYNLFLVLFISIYNISIYKCLKNAEKLDKIRNYDIIIFS